MRGVVVVVLGVVAAAFAGPTSADLASSAPDKDGWINLMTPDAWKKFDPGWIITSAGEVKLDPEKDTRLRTMPVKNGQTWLNGTRGRLPNLITKEKFGDCEVHVEFLIAKRSNAGIKFHEVYEIQISFT